MTMGIQKVNKMWIPTCVGMTAIMTCVIPMTMGIQKVGKLWIPTCVGMTAIINASHSHEKFLHIPILIHWNIGSVFPFFDFIPINTFLDPFRFTSQKSK